MTVQATEGTLQAMAGAFQDALEARDVAAAQEMLAAWSDAYWATRRDFDALLAWVEAQRAAGEPITVSALRRERRFRVVLGEALNQMRRYARAAGATIQGNQAAALGLAIRDAERLVREAVRTGLPGVTLDFDAINPTNLRTMVGFLRDGTPLADHLARTAAPEAVDRLRSALLRGLTQGWDQRRMVRAFTEGLAVAHGRAVTILRTESLRIYRETTRQTYQANTKVLESWQWQCALDRRSCPACVIQHGTRHPVTETLDGHPRCRCAMVPLTVSWADLGVEGVEDTRTVLGSGADWFNAQSAAVQRAMVGPLKYAALREGRITLDDLVGRRSDDTWGSMRFERSLRAIVEGRDANWGNLP